MKFNKELYSKTALMKAAYNYIDIAYVHLDTDDRYYYVNILPKNNDNTITQEEFANEMLTQSLRHEVYLQTKSIRELMMARAMATSVVIEDEYDVEEEPNKFSEDQILKDWFDEK